MAFHASCLASVMKRGYLYLKTIKRHWNTYNWESTKGILFVYTGSMKFIQGKNFYGIQPDKEIAFLYLIWAVLYLLPVYGSYMCLDLDLELQSFYKNILKQDKNYVYELIEQYEDDIFAHDKELIKCVFEFIIEYVSPRPEFNAQEGYVKMIDDLISIGEKGDPKFPALFLFKAVLWDFQNVTDRNHRKVLNYIYRTRSTSFIYQNLKSIFDYLNIIHEKHPVFSKFLRFDGIEVFWQIKYNSSSDDIPNKSEACIYVAESLYNHLSLIENNITRFISMDLMAKCYEDGIGIEKNLKKALEIIESSRNFAGFVEEDFPYMRVGKLYEKLGDANMSAICYEKYIGYSQAKRDLPIKFYRQGKYYNQFKKDQVKAMEVYIKGLSSPPEFYTFQLEFYTRKCKKKIGKIIQTNQELATTFSSELEVEHFFEPDR